MMLTESQLEWCRENIKTPAHPNLFREMEAIANANRIERNLGEQPHDNQAGSLDRNVPGLNGSLNANYGANYVFR
jgi:hypothetical protein